MYCQQLAMPVFPMYLANANENQIIIVYNNKHEICIPAAQCTIPPIMSAKTIPPIIAGSTICAKTVNPLLVDALALNSTSAHFKM